MGYNIKKEFEVDKNKEDYGSEMELDDETFLMVRPTSYIPYKQALAKTVFKERRNLRKAGAMEEFSRKVTPRLVAKHLVCELKGQLTDGSESVEFTWQNMEALFVKYPTFLEDVLGFSSDLENYKAEEIQELGNE